MKCWRAERERHWGKHDARRDLDSTALERNRKWLVASLFCGNLETMLGEIDTTATTYFWNGKPAGNNQHVERGVWFFKVPATAGNDSETLRTICRDLYVGDLDSLSKFRFSFDFLNNYQLLDLLSLPLSRPETIDVRKIHLNVFCFWSCVTGELVIIRNEFTLLTSCQFVNDIESWF